MKNNFMTHKPNKMYIQVTESRNVINEDMNGNEPEDKVTKYFLIAIFTLIFLSIIKSVFL